jgi:hypothetical protein
MAHHLQSFLQALRGLSSTNRTETQIQGLRHLQELFAHIGSVLPHFSADTWIQPALNWPAAYVPKYIDGFRENLI